MPAAASPEGVDLTVTPVKQVLCGVASPDQDLTVTPVKKPKPASRPASAGGEDLLATPPTKRSQPQRTMHCTDGTAPIRPIPKGTDAKSVQEADTEFMRRQTKLKQQLSPQVYLDIMNACASAACGNSWFENGLNFQKFLSGTFVTADTNWYALHPNGDSSFVVTRAAGIQSP